MIDDLIIVAERQFFRNTISIRIGKKFDGRSFSEALPLEFNQVSEGAASGPPCLELTPNDAQSLMDQLWHVGLRPTEGTGSAGAMAATQRHLEDMRTLVFKESK